MVFHRFDREVGIREIVSRSPIYSIPISKYHPYKTSLRFNISCNKREKERFHIPSSYGEDTVLFTPPPVSKMKVFNFWIFFS